MTELTESGDGTTLDVPVTMFPRTRRRSALRPASSRRELYAVARAEARVIRGRNTFVWRGRILPIGVPLAVSAGLFVWRRRRSVGDGAGVAGAVLALSYLEARAEWGMRLAAYRRRRDSD